MSDLHLPCAEHLFHFGDHFFEREGPLEGEARFEMSADLARSNIRNDGSVGDRRLQHCEIVPDWIDVHLPLILRDRLIRWLRSH